ncbi:SsgA family sporulation/cell division regulator [Salinispora arenicola]|uniref:Sporulation and cell division protein SsgA n=1 Tax=Salinispora arenicola TaxID=168697 RepID=A0A542XUK3_SALAC|nr:SsgA family sporulation/cell division regulator [Salinispora arenicola]TQL39525.1 sporulation and cell division protein SsgA [Salinispora arenicola]GIM86444.1 sporulation-specific cell division protein SsgB [Salinispora arenicola]
MSVIRPTTVEVETSLRLVAPDATALPVRASLRYDPADPYAVHVLFHAESAGGEAVSWSFARELLVAGLDEPAGIGDVRVWPWATPRGDFVALALSSPDGNALFEVPRSVLVRFLRRTYVVVARGREAEHLDVDTAVSRLLAGR